MAVTAPPYGAKASPDCCKAVLLDYTGVNMSRNGRGRKNKSNRQSTQNNRSRTGQPVAKQSGSDPAGLASIAELASRLDRAWEKGWHPEDVARSMVDDGSIDRAIFADALALNRVGWHAQAGSLWTDQADSQGAITPWWDQDKPYWPQFHHRYQVGFGQPDQARLALAVSFLAMVCEKGAPQPIFEALPTQPGWNHRANSAAGSSDGMLAKVRALLSKAEASEYEHEAEAFSAKAQELITRYSIDVALLADTLDVPGGRKVYISDPYAKAKFMLLAGVAEANNCRCVWGQSRKTATLIGHQSDLHLVEVLFTSLLLQGTGAVLASGAKTDWQGKSSTRSWRNAFWHGFAGRIGERLAEATAAAHGSHQQETGLDFLPVLARRSEAVEQALNDAFPKLGTIRTSVSNVDGLDAGHRFANQAQLDSERHLRAQAQGALGSS